MKHVSEIILTCDHVTLPDTLQELTVPADAVMFLERLPSRWLDRSELADGIRFSAYDTAIDCTQWERGRVFCQAWEVRWEGQHAVYTGATITLSHFVPGPDLSQWARREAGYYLWGQRHGNRFIELQVARVLTYPVTAGTRVKLRVAEWFDTAGELVASRCMRLEEA